MGPLYSYAKCITVSFLQQLFFSLPSLESSQAIQLDENEQISSLVLQNALLLPHLFIGFI